MANLGWVVFVARHDDLRTSRSASQVWRPSRAQQVKVPVRGRRLRVWMSVEDGVEVPVGTDQEILRESAWLASAITRWLDSEWLPQEIHEVRLSGRSDWYVIELLFGEFLNACLFGVRLSVDGLVRYIRDRFWKERRILAALFLPLEPSWKRWTLATRLLVHLMLQTRCLSFCSGEEFYLCFRILKEPSC